MNYHKQYVYTKERRTFGRQCLFTNRNELIFSEQPHHEYFKDYILKNPVERGTQLSKKMALTDCNTENVQHVHHGMNHIEGGWPKDVNMNDEEQTLRYRKKIEREESWAQQVPALGKRVLHSVLQNNAVNIYENYFEDTELMNPPADYSAHVLGVYRDQITPVRPITHLSWSPTVSNRIVCSYTSLDFRPNEMQTDSYIWDLDDANKPELVLRGPASIISAEWNPRDEHMIAAGLRTGAVAIWDPRAGVTPVSFSSKEASHRERVNSLRWLHSKTNTEFFSGSSDSTVHFWDARILRGPYSTILVDPDRTDQQERLRSHAVSILEFEHTISTRFMVGTELGFIFIGNRKGMSPSEILLSRFKVLAGPVYDLMRNPIYVKYFLVVGDWCAKIYTEDCKESALIRTKNHSCELRSGTWSLGRSSLFFLGRFDGVLEVWDLLMSQEKPILEIQLCIGPIWSLKSSENGKLLAVGTDTGDFYIIEMADALTVSDRNDKTALGAIFDRETRRIKLLEGRMREINLKIASEAAKKRKIEEHEAKLMAEQEGVPQIFGDGSTPSESADRVAPIVQEADEIPPAEPVGESVSNQFIADAEEATDEASKAEEKASKAADDESESDQSEDEEVKTLIEIQNAEKLFLLGVDDEEHKRKEKVYKVVKTAFDVMYDKEQQKRVTIDDEGEVDGDQDENMGEYGDKVAE